MFKIPQVNVIESDQGLSVQVEIARILYADGEKGLYISSEIEAGPDNTAIFKKTIRNWEPPYTNEAVDDNKRAAILNAMHRAFRWKGKWINVI